MLRAERRFPVVPSSTQQKTACGGVSESPDLPSERIDGARLFRDII